MNDERQSENLAAQVVLDELARAASPEDTAVVPPDDEVAEVLGRLYLEAFGLLAYGAEPAAAPEGTRGALLARLSGEETQEVEPVAGPRAEVPAPPVPERPAPAPPPRSRRRRAARRRRPHRPGRASRSLAVARRARSARRVRRAR